MEARKKLLTILTIKCIDLSYFEEKIVTLEDCLTQYVELSEQM